jgi:hypothetical protein
MNCFVYIQGTIRRTQAFKQRMSAATSLLEVSDIPHPISAEGVWEATVTVFGVTFLVSRVTL